MSVWRRVLGSVFGTILGLSVATLAYDRFAAVYTDVTLTNIRQQQTLVLGTIGFIKHRDCEPVKGSLVAFAHFGGVEREPVQYTNSKGEPLQLRDLPASEKPYRLRVGWRLASQAPVPDALSVTFRARCGIWTERYTLGPFATS